MRHRSAGELAAATELLRRSPAELGVVELIVRRPAPGEREVLHEGTLDPTDGLVGDGWRQRGSRSTPDGSARPDMQLTLMHAGVAAFLAGTPERRALAGDQLYVDLDLSIANLPAGTRLAVGSAVIEITDALHKGCHKFAARFGAEALRWVNTPEGRALRLRGVNARVVAPGTVRPGDPIAKLPLAAHREPPPAGTAGHQEASRRAPAGGPLDGP